MWTPRFISARCSLWSVLDGFSQLLWIWGILYCNYNWIIIIVDSKDGAQLVLIAGFHIVPTLLQVPPDFYIPDFDEDEQNPDERVDRKWKKSSLIIYLFRTPFRFHNYCYPVSLECSLHPSWMWFSGEFMTFPRMGFWEGGCSGFESLFQSTVGNV